MTPIIQISVNSLAFRLSGLQNDTYKKPIKYCSISRTKIASLKLNRFKLRAFWERDSIGEDGILGKNEGWNRKKKREVVVKFNQGFGFNGGGGGGKDDGATARVLGNLALAIGLTYLSFTGQLGWLLDAIVSIWVLSLSIWVFICVKYIHFAFCYCLSNEIDAFFTCSSLHFLYPLLVWVHFCGGQDGIWSKTV